MASKNFAMSLKRVLVHEGGWSNHPRDPGGVTLHGIIQRVYDADRKRRGLAPRPLTPAMAKEAEFLKERDAIYRKQYWDAIRADELPDGVDYCVFDGAVNSGPSQSAKWLQRALASAGLYKGAIDGQVGAGTIAACNVHPNHDGLVADICRQRLTFLQNLRTWDAFGVGWGRRVRDVKAGAEAMATGANAPKAKPIPADEMAKAPPTETKVSETAEGKAATDTATAGGGGGLGFSLFDNLDTASNYLAQIAGLPDWLARYVIWAVIVGALGFAAWSLGRIAWRAIRTWRERSAAEKERRAEAAVVDLDVEREKRRPRMRTGSHAAKAKPRKTKRAA